MSYYDEDPWAMFDPFVADELRKGFQAEVDRRMRPAEEAAEDQALAAEEQRVARRYPDYASQRAAVLNYAIANGIEDLERAYQDFTLGRQEMWMRQEFGDAYDRHRLEVFEKVLNNESDDIESAYHEVRKSTEMADRAAHRAARLQELENKFSPADQLEKEAIQRDAMADGERDFERKLKAHNEATGDGPRARHQRNIDQAREIANIRDARFEKVDMSQRIGDREELDMIAEGQIREANAVDELNDRADSTGIPGGLGSHPEIGL